MRDTLEHHKLNLHDNKKSPPQPPLPGLPPQPLACLPPPPSPPQPPTNVAEKKGGNVIAHQTNKEGGKKEGSRPLFHTDSKSPDWTCNLCHTKNVSHLKLCSKCPGKQMHYEDHTIAMKAGDWGCTVCGNQKNFAYRATCYRCNSPRLPHARSTAGVGNKRCSGGKIISANIGEASEKLWKSPQHASDILDTRQYPEGDQVAQMEHDRLLEQEKQFDSMFEKWEANFEQWKSDNETNPDWDYVQSHIDDMNKLREKMLKRREALNRKREQLLGIPNVGGVPLAKPTEAEGRKKLMEKRWSQAEREGVEDNSSLLNKPKNIFQNSCPDDSSRKTSGSTSPISSKEENQFYFRREPLSRNKSSCSQTSNDSLFERRPPKRIEEYWNPRISDVIDYGRGRDMPPKVPKVIDYGHGDSFGAADNDRASSRGHPSAPIISASSKSLQKSDQLGFKAKTEKVEEAGMGTITNIGDLLEPPGRYIRPPKIIVILRGLPGSGKTHFAKSIRAKESDLGSDAPRILDLDAYFEADGEYDYDEAMAGKYRCIFMKTFKKNIDDGLFSFIIVDSVNDKTDHFREMWSYAKQKGFEVYIAEFLGDPVRCAKRNVHSRSLEAVQMLNIGWELTPRYMNRLDLSTYLDLGEIEHVEMEEKPCTDNKVEDEDTTVKEDDHTSKIQFKISKWEVMENDQKLAQLDGISGRRLNRQSSPKHESIENWLESHTECDNDRKKVRWADIEERRKQLKMRELGFIVGSCSNWIDQKAEPFDARKALEKTKLIPNRLEAE